MTTEISKDQYPHLEWEEIESWDCGYGEYLVRVNATEYPMIATDPVTAVLIVLCHLSLSDLSPDVEIKSWKSVV